MKRIASKKIREVVRDLCIKANLVLRPDVLAAIRTAARKETNSRAKRFLRDIIENAAIARRNKVAICQDTGMVVVVAEIGQNVLVTGGSIFDAVNAGVAEAYRKGCFRKSVVADPVLRRNTGTNGPAVLVTDIVKGDKVRIAVMPKGFGSENKSRSVMLRPTAGIKEIEDFVIETVRRAGPDACPPLIVGVGMGGTFDSCALLAKKALLRPVTRRSSRKHIASLERSLLGRINALRIGPMGLGGRTTALGVNIETAPTHIAGLPVAVNISCHATRGAEAVV